MKGKCYYCNKELGKSGVTRHIKSCSEIREYISGNTEESRSTKEKFLIEVNFKYEPSEYWLYINVDEDCTLKELDQFLRDIWLECCGHLSCFTINGEVFEVRRTNTLDNNENKNMNVTLNSIVEVGSKFKYEYDFGSTTELNIKVLDKFTCGEDIKPIEIMARNNEPIFQCSRCGEIATYFNHREDALLCASCRKRNFNSNDEMIEKMEFTNSPRAGMCAYYGSQDDELAYVPNNNLWTDKVQVAEINRVKDSSIINEVEEEETSFEDMMESAIPELEKYYEKMWSSTEKIFDLDYHLQKLGKKELLTIGENLGISKIKSLSKDKIKDKIIHDYEERVLLCLNNMDTQRLSYLLDMISSEGFKESDDFIDEEYCYYFAHRAMVFTGEIEEKYVVIMPKETQDLIRSVNMLDIRRQLKKNEEIINLCNGMSKYYGVITIEEFKELLKEYLDYDIANIDVEGILKEVSAQGRFINYEDSVISNYEVLDKDKILKEHILRKDIEYKTFTKTDLLDAAKEYQIPKNKAYNKFYKFLASSFEADKEQCDEIIKTIVDDLNHGVTLNEIVEEFLSGVEVDSEVYKNIIINEVESFLNNTPQWMLKGYTLRELQTKEQQVESKDKVGRNDPCPCGSGKKYKKCCGGKVIDFEEMKNNM
ncbi:SEC-C metal-binding domain-containing protein [Clostridium sp.]|uniref:IS1096 element passenger TnpR family protein n=1 Tax=Clostridium sp. TaxID=1506 RepID=UPI0032166920